MATIIMSTEMFRESIWIYLKNKDIDSLKQLLADHDEVFLLSIMHELSPEELVLIYRLLSKDKALAVFEQLDIGVQETLLNSFTEEKAVEIISQLDPDDRVRLLDELPAKVMKRLINALSPEERQITNLLLGFEAETAGRLMTTEYLRLRRNLTVGEAMLKVKEMAKSREAIYTLFITDEKRILEGILSLRELLIADEAALIDDIMQKEVIKVSTDTDQEDVARQMQALDLLSIPVVDKENRLVGIITVDDAMDILEEEATEDILTSAGMSDLGDKESRRSSVLIDGSILAIWKVRLPFLILTLFGGMLAGTVIANFEEALESIAVVAIFIPLIMDLGGSTGTQSSTVFARGVLLGHVQMKNFMKHLLKELGVGFSMGIVVGLFAGLIAYFWHGIPGLGFAVGLAILSVMTFATLLGFIVPYVLIKLDLDQAAGTTAIITSLKDIAGLLIYFVLVATFLGAYL